MPKGRVRKHTAAEIQKKIDSHKNIGGGATGKDSRAPKCAIVCSVCKITAPSMTVIAEHYAAKHPKLTFNPAEYEQKA